MSNPAQQRANIAFCLKQFEFTRLFIEELGWTRYHNSLTVEVANATYTLRGVAEKQGVAVLICDPDANGGIPEYNTRKKIDEQVTKQVHEHLIIFVDSLRNRQSWLWVRRKPGQCAAYRGEEYYKGQSGERLIQKLQQIAIDMADEESISLIDVMLRLEKGFDVERTTKKFFERFQTEHKRFEQAITGIADDEWRRWYASLMLNRLMFVYFIQRKGFLDNNIHYLADRLAKVQALGSDRFYSFYRGFLLHLFHDGLGKPPVDRKLEPELAALIGSVPYLNGGLFEVHKIEHDNREIQIPDSVFANIFAFFDDFDWYLDDRPLANDKEINPDVLGYIFEKYINQKQMGAYYTKEDITGYIGRNTIVPFLFDRAKADDLDAFAPDGEVWRLLRDDPDRYIYEAVRHGVDEPLPSDIAAGIQDVAKRAGWNKPASAPFALPTETWREHIARRTRCLELRERISSGGVTEVNDLITYNLDIELFARDVIERCEDPLLLRAMWKAISSVTVLDPTCGSGAFLFAALNILEPLYDACLTRMAAFVADYQRAGHLHSGQDFAATLARVSAHVNHRYFVLKSIIINNLYGVDIMEEACEIAKLRLFLKLAAQVDAVDNLEPLPDIDFNIRAGNTLVGFATYKEAGAAVSGNIIWYQQMAQIEEQAKDLASLFARFREQQTTHGGHVTKEDKQNLRDCLATLGATLNRFLAAEYGIDESHYPAPADYAAKLVAWQKSHQPFHWFVEFYAIVHECGGFDVIIGNPPYVEYTKIKSAYQPRGFSTIVSGNLYGMVTETALKISGLSSRMGLILPMSVVSTPRMKPVRGLITSSSEVVYLSHYSGNRNPSVLFEGVEMRLSICLAKKGSRSLRLRSFSTDFRRWAVAARENLFETICYLEVPTKFQSMGHFPKIGHGTEAIILNKVEEVSHRKTMGDALVPNGLHQVYAHRIASYFVKALTFIPHFSNKRDGTKRSEDYKIFAFARREQASAACCLINSSLFYMHFIVFSDAYHCGRELIEQFPIDISRLAEDSSEAIVRLEAALMNDLTKHSETRGIEYRNTGMVEMQKFFPKLSKSILDEIDRVLAQHYGFTDEELDFIINYDIKYRMGQETADEDDGEEQV